MAWTEYQTEDRFLARVRRDCCFGLAEVVAPAIAAISSGLGAASAGIAGGLGSLGIGSATAGILGTGLTDAAVGAGTGALEGAVTGGNIGNDALIGGLTGGLGGAGGGLASNLGLDSGIGAALGGAAGGLAGAGATGGNLLTGAIEGGIGGYGANSLNPTATPGAGAASGGAGAGASAAATAAPGVAAAGGPAPDLTGVTVTPQAALGGSGSLTNSLGFPSTSVTAPTITPPSVDPSSLGMPNLSAASATPSGGVGGILKDLGITPGQALQGAGMAYSALKPESGVEKQLQASANGLGTQGQALQSYLASGTLPPGLQTSVNLATNDAIAGIKSQYANMGASGSTAEAQAIADAKLRSQAQASQYAMSLLQTGIQTTGMSDSLLNGILANNNANDKDLTDALAAFSATGAGGSGITLKVGA